MDKGMWLEGVQVQVPTSRRSLITGLALFASGCAWFAATCTLAAPTSGTSNDYGMNDYGIRQVARINEAMQQSWEEYEITPSAPAADGEWCRRVYLDILGRIPTVDELTQFLKESSPNKKMELVNTLLFDENYTEEFARNWTTIWTNILIGRSDEDDSRSLVNRPGMQKYLRDSFARNKPYNKMVYELVSATGANSPGTSGFNGAVNFLTGKMEEDASQATAQTSRIFLGLQVQCTQCHNHPFNEWKQAKYWEMNAFFRQTVALRRFVQGSRDIRMVELDNQDFGGEGSDPSEAELYYELRNGLLKVAYPTFVDGTTIEKSGYISDVNRREELAQLVAQSTYMQDAITNRMWAHFMGYGFTKPVDDMGPHNAPTHPDLLSYLGGELRDHSFNLKELMRWIALSRPYSLSSKVNRTNATDDPQLGDPPKFSRFYLRQMRAEELYESLLVATRAHRTKGSYDDQEKAKSDWLSQFTIAFGTDEGDETTTFNGTITQALMLFNGEMIKQATSDQQGGLLKTVTSSNLRPNQKIEYLYMAGLGRKPSRREVSIANQLLAARQGDATAALQDVWWAVLNSNEFILNH